MRQFWYTRIELLGPLLHILQGAGLVVGIRDGEHSIVALLTGTETPVAAIPQHVPLGWLLVVWCRVRPEDSAVTGQQECGQNSLLSRPEGELVMSGAVVIVGLTWIACTRE